MKRARNKNSQKKNKREYRREYRYESDMTELGYDPDTFAENESDSQARPYADADGGFAPEDTVDLGGEMPETADTEETEKAVEESSPEEDGVYPDSPDGEYSFTEDENTDGGHPKKRKPLSPKKKKLLIFSVSLVTIVLLFFVSLSFGGFFSGVDTGNENEDSTVPVDKATGEMNVLILGVDKEGLRTDTIIVACYDLDNNTIDMLSIPRDTRVRIGNSYQKINAAHAIYEDGEIRGPQGTIDAVTDLTGIPINYYVEFSFDAFKNTIDALGGIDFYVPQRMHYSDPVQDLYIDLEEGQQLLDGDKAEQLVRFRQYRDGDIERVKVQQSFIQAVAEQKLNLSIITRLPELYEVLQDDIKTNFTLLDIAKYINNLQELSASNINMFQLPGTFSGPEYDASYWLPDMDAIEYMIESDFYRDVPSHSPASSSGADEDDASSTPRASSSTSSRSTRRPSSTDRREPSPTARRTQRPAETPTPTQAPTRAPTQAPTQAPTERPSRPTPNPTDGAE